MSNEQTDGQIEKLVGPSDSSKAIEEKLLGYDVYLANSALLTPLEVEQKPKIVIMCPNKQAMDDIEKALQALAELETCRSKQPVDVTVDDRETELCEAEDKIIRLQAENRQLREELEDYHNAEKFIADPPHDQACCGCVSILRTENKRLKEDCDFLLSRSVKAGQCSFHSDRDTGTSSNSIVAIAYGQIGIEEQELPCDDSDLAACKKMWEKLPEHRKTPVAIKAMNRAEQALKERR